MEIDEIKKLDFSELKDYVDSRHHFLSNKDYMISEFRGEKGINNDYKGRQLLELIQNADDAGSKFVNIIIDSNDCKLQVVNEGDPFTFAGFRSLMITNLSTKRKKKYIGNKGLGFRSILNWSEKVTIGSAGCVVTFSAEQAKNKFLELYPIEKNRNDILKEFEYPDDAIPFPIFSIPNVQKAKVEQELTTIEITYYKDVEKDILNQIETLRKEVLLFLNHIEKIHISVDGNTSQYISQKTGDVVSIQDQTWKIYNNKIDGEDPLLPAKYKSPDINEDESFSLKIAIQEGLKDDVYKLFTFFPTKIGLYFPMVIHGTFELDSSRNRIVETAKNKFLVEELIKLIFKISNTFFGETANWDKLRLLNYKGNKDAVLEEFGFYTAIDNKIKQLDVLPCIDGKYRSYTNVKFHSNEFSELIEELNQQKYFPELLQKIPTDIVSFFRLHFPNYLTDRSYPSKTIKERAEAVSKEIHKSISVDLYAKWVANLRILLLNDKFYLSILYNESGELIESNNTIFTPPSKKAAVEVPTHINMDYLNPNLYESLNRYYKISDDNERSRKLKDKLESFTNIQSFEPAPVLTKIVTGTNHLISSTDKLNEKHVYVKDMLKSLYNYFNLSNRAKDSQIRTNNIPVINVSGEIINAKDSFLSNSYPIGLIRKELLGDLYSDNELIAPGLKLGLGEDEDVEEFLVDFLGVNKFLQLERQEDKTSYDRSYNNFVFYNKTKPDKFRSGRISYTQIKNLNSIQDKINNCSLTKEQFVAWICVDKDIKELLHSFSDTDFRFDKNAQVYNSYVYRLADVPSFVRYQLSALELFDNFLLNDMGTSIINDFSFDFKAEVFQEQNIDSTVIKETLIQLGAKTEFNDLDIERVESILKDLPIKDEYGKYARKIYQLAIERFKETEEPLVDITGLLLHSTKERVKQYLPHSEVYYANSIGLPRKILNEKAILNYPKRAGEQNIAEFFSVQTFGDINYTAGEFNVNNYSTSQLKLYLKQIRPYILVHRLQKLKSEADIKEAIKIVKSINIVLCTDLNYEFNENYNQAEEYDFVPVKDEKYSYLIKYTDELTIEDLKQDSELSDVISEVYSIAFDLANLRTEIRNIFRNDTRDTLHQIIDEFGEENLLNAKSKLEITVGELDFWQIIYGLKKISEKLPSIEDESDFRKIVASEFNIDRKLISQIDFDFIDSKESLKFLHELFLSLKISQQEFNSNFGESINFYAFHEYSLSQKIDNVKQDFIQSLWADYSTKTIERQKTFISQINSFGTNTISVIAENCKFSIQVNYSLQIAQLIQNKYGLFLTEQPNTEDGFISQYETNKELIGFSEDLANSLSNEDRSLLYFNIGTEELNKLKEKVVPKERNGNDSEPLANPETAPEGITEPKGISELLPRGKKKKASNGKNKSGSYSSNGGSHSSEDEKARIELGLRCEEDVLNSLRDLYAEENIQWVSGYSNHPEKSDYWGYDIKYRVNKESEWQLVEVKSFYSGSFFFTKRELEVGKNNSNKYFLYLVNEQGISSVLFENLIDENNELNLDNEYFSIEVKDYKFTRI